MFSERLWRFVIDMNYDGSVTISDVWLWLKWLYYYPGDCFIWFLLNGVRPIGKFLEITADSYSKGLSFTTSLIFWLIVYFIIWAASQENYDKAGDV